MSWPSAVYTGFPDPPRNLLPGRIEGWPQGTQVAANDAERLLSTAVAWWDAKFYRDGDRFVRNRGIGNDLLNLQLGSSVVPNSNDPLFLNWTGQNYVYLPRVSGNFLSVPDSAALDITGDIDIRVQVAMDDWIDASVQRYFLDKSDGGAGQSSYYLMLRNDGRIRLAWYPNGTTLVVAASVPSISIADGETSWIRATLDVDNGASGYDVKFFTSPDGVTWTQLGATVTGVGVTSIFAGTAPLSVGRFSTNVIDAKIYRAQIYSDLTETNKVLDVDTSVITTGAATSFTALTGQTVTINRGTAGRKTVAVVSPCWLFGTDDYMEVADNALLDFGASDSFTVVLINRQTSYTGSQAQIYKMESAAAGPGWHMRNATGTASTLSTGISDGTALNQPAATGRVNGTLYSSVLVRDVSADTVAVYLNGALSQSLTDTTTGTLANSFPLRIGRVSGAGGSYSDMELIAAAIFRRALTSTEITTLNTYYQSRIGG